MIKIEIDKNIIFKNCGIDIEKESDYISYMQSLIDMLESHNKNYTKEQYYAILDIKEILNAMEVLI